MGMSQQDESGQRSKGRCKEQEVGRGWIQIGTGESSKKKHGQHQQSRKSSSK